MESKAAELVIQTLRLVRAHWQCSVSHRLRIYMHLVHSALLALMLLNVVFIALHYGRDTCGRKMHTQ